MIPESTWKVTTGMLLIGFLILAMLTINIAEQRNEYADLYFNEPILQESNWNCKMQFHVEGVFPVGDFNMVVDSFEIELPCNEAMSYNFLKGTKGLGGK